MAVGAASEASVSVSVSVSHLWLLDLSFADDQDGWMRLEHNGDGASGASLVNVSVGVSVDLSSANDDDSCMRLDRRR